MESPFDAATMEYARYRSLGLTQNEAAKKAGFSRNTGARREREPGYDQLVQEFRRKFREEEEEPLTALVPDAWRVIALALKDNDLSAAQYVIDRRYGKPVARTELNAGGPIRLEVVWDEGPATDAT